MKKFKYILMLMVLIFVSSCNEKEILKEEPKDFFAVDNGYTTPQNIVYALTSCYSKAIDLFGGNYVYIPMIGGTDAARGLTGKELLGSATDINVNTETAFWGNLYQIISYSNTILSRIDKIDYPSEELKNAHKAEARFFRAFAYRSLANLYGGVPLELDEVTVAKRDYVRASREETYQQCVEDLKFAAQYLPSADKVEAPGRVPKGAANHLLAEVYISLKQWDNAIAAASAVIDGGEYHLMTTRFGRRANVPGMDPYWDLFQRGSTDRGDGNMEGIWTMQFALDIPGGSGIPYSQNRMTFERNFGSVYWFYPRDPDGVRFYHIWTTQDGGRPGDAVIVLNHNRFDIWNSDWNNDMRNKENNIFRNWKIINPASKYFGKRLSDFDHDVLAKKTPVDTSRAWQPLWMKVTTPGDHPDALIVNKATGELLASAGGTFHGMYFMRLAETYLLRAEAYLGKGDKVNAAKDINKVRERANAKDVDPADVDIDYILDERLRELYLEEPRRMTLNRLGLWYDRVMKYNPGIQATAKPYMNLLPIPFSTIEVNTKAKLTQNPGYAN